MTVEAATKPISRDRWGRPYVRPINGGKAVPYTRVTTLASSIDDRWALEQWKCRMTAIGVAEREDLLLAVSAHRDDKKKLNKVCDDAIEAAKGRAGANTGTALHKLTEAVDRGEELPVIPDTAMVDLMAYKAAMEPFEVVAIEKFVVVDELEVGGTPDRIVRYRDEDYILDLKTGSGVSYIAGSTAVQLACYSRGVYYDPNTHERTPLNVNQERAILLHLPAGEGKAELYWLDIALGWEAAKLAKRVRRYRKYSKNGLLSSFTPTL